MESQQIVELLLSMQARMDANQERMETNRQTDRYNLHETMKTNQDDLLKTVKEEMQATIGKMEDGIHSIRSELENSNQRTQNLRKELTETIERTQVELQTVEVPLDVQTREFRREIAAIRSDVTNAKIHGSFNETRTQIEAIERESQARLEAVQARAELEGAQGVGTSTVQPPTFNGNTSCAVFRRQFETVAEHNRLSDQEKSTYLITALKGRAADVLHGIPTNTTYEGALQALEDQSATNILPPPTAVN
jgi:predicted  nucleic acid-binding Zn-ribbon protein